MENRGGPFGCGQIDVLMSRTKAAENLPFEDCFDTLEPNAARTLA